MAAFSILGQNPMTDRNFPLIPLPSQRFLPGKGMEHPSKNGIAHFGDAVLLLNSATINAQGDSPAFRYGIDCFNEGFFWEAHEFWEPLWQSARKDQPQLAAALKSLIQFAAANVQLLCGRPESWHRLAQRAIKTATGADVQQTQLLGIEWHRLLAEWQEVLQGNVPQSVPIDLLIL